MNTASTTIQSAPGKQPDLSSVKGRDIVIISLLHWDLRMSGNSRDIAYELAKHNRVLYVNFPITRKTYLDKDNNKDLAEHCRIIRTKSNPLRELGPNLWNVYPTTLIESAKWLPSTLLFKGVTYINNRRFVKSIKFAMDELNFKNIILINDNDIYNGFYLRKMLQPGQYIYYLRDFLQGFDYWKKHTSVMEPQLIKDADAVVCNSVFLKDYAATLTKHSYYIGQGCNLKIFNPSQELEVPEDIRHLPRPIIGYAGALDSQRLDEKIIAHIADSLPDHSIVLLGPPDETFSNSSLKEKKNVHFTGKRPIEQLPAYLQAFDVCINPQFQNIITQANYPLKIDEYLAMGRPVVATRTATMELFQEYVYLGDKAEDYPALIRKALTENNGEKASKRIAFAQSHTWENSVAELCKAINITNKHTKNEP